MPLSGTNLCSVLPRVLRMEPQMDHLQALMVPAGSDRFKDIGRPRGTAADASTSGAGIAEWQALYQTIFPSQPQKASQQQRVVDLTQHAEQGMHTNSKCPWGR